MTPTPSLDRTRRVVRRVVRRAAPLQLASGCLRSLAALPLALALAGCDRPDAVEHEPDPVDSAAGDAAASTKYVFDPGAMRTLRGDVLVVQPFQRMQGTRYGVRLRVDVAGERVYV